MTNTLNTNDLVIERILDVSRDKLFAAWRDPDALKQWFAPQPWTTPVADYDFRAGGKFNTTMRSPEGVDFPNRGLFLEVTEPERIVFTDAYTEGWTPSDEHFMTAEITFEDLGDGRTTYRVVCRHRNAEDRQKHEDMGFFGGWNQCIDQLEAYAQTH